MAVLPTVRARRDDDAPPSYQEYLQTASWRITRNRALMLAGYRCERCNAKHDLQVHHRTYVRLGHEWDQDLEVLCDACHGDHHLVAKAQRGDPVRLFAVLVGRALQDPTVASYGDLAESIKAHAARLRIPYDGTMVGAAITLVTRRPYAPAAAATSTGDPGAPAPPLDKLEALRIFATLADDLPDLPLERLIKTMPAGPTVEEQRAHEAKVRAQADDMRRLPTKRRPLAERLAEIFQ